MVKCWKQVNSDAYLESQQAESGRTQVQDQPWLHRRTCLLWGIQQRRPRGRELKPVGRKKYAPNSLASSGTQCCLLTLHQIRLPNYRVNLFETGDCVGVQKLSSLPASSSQRPSAGLFPSEDHVTKKLLNPCPPFLSVVLPGLRLQSVSRSSPYSARIWQSREVQSRPVPSSKAFWTSFIYSLSDTVLESAAEWQ